MHRRPLWTTKMRDISLPGIHVPFVFLLCAIWAAPCASPAQNDGECERQSVEYLLAQRNAITNWEAFAFANKISGWDLNTPVCEWTGITCNGATGTYDVRTFECRVDSNGYAIGGLCQLPHAAGSLADAAADASSMRALVITNQSLSGAAHICEPTVTNANGSSVAITPPYQTCSDGNAVLPSCALANSAPPSPVDSSSVPIGAIVGGVVGGVALIVLAFFAFRRGGWLRKKRGKPADQESDLDPKLSSGGLKYDPSGQLFQGSSPTDVERGGVPVSAAPGAAGPAVAGMAGDKAAPIIDTLITQSTIAAAAAPSSGAAFAAETRDRLPYALPASYETSGLGPDVDTFISQSTAGHTPPPGSDVPTQHRSAQGSEASASASLSRSTDPLLSYIASVMASRPVQPGSSGQLPLPASGPASATSNLSGMSAVTAPGTPNSPLHADVQQWAVQWNDLDIKRPIGRGSFGWVYLAHWHQTPVAVKVLVNPAEIGAGLELPEQTMSELQRESGVMARMRHPNIVSFMGLCALPPCILTEYCSRGSLFELLRNPAAASQLTWAVRLSLAMDAARGLLYLHTRSPPIIHRDIKSPNLLVDEGWRLKVADFNLSKILSTAKPSSNVNTAGGANNPIWLAPEVVEGGQATAESDVFAFGLVMFELLTWQLPWGIQAHYKASGALCLCLCLGRLGMRPGLQAASIAQMVVSGQRPQVPAREALPGPDLPDADSFEAYCSLMRECYAHAPSDRPTFSEVATRLRALQPSPA
ncbi:Serine/threonine-protein kinase CTR1 [Chlorella vulgaris]